MKTKRVLKEWVKVALNSIALGTCLLVIVGLLSLDNTYTKTEINQCVNAGHTNSYCEAHS